MARNRFSRLIRILAGVVADADEVLQLEGRLERVVHFWTLVTRQFMRGRCFVRASALSFSTLLALIPLLALALSVTSNFLSRQQEASLTQFVENAVARLAPAVSVATNSAAPETGTGPASPQSTNGTDLAESGAGRPAAESGSSAAPVAGAVAVSANMQNQVAQEIHSLVHTASSGALGATGLVFFVITAISLLRGIEETFNDLWGVTRSRSWWLQFMLYWAIISLGPILLATALGFAGSAHLGQTRQLLESSPFLRPIYFHILPILILSLTLAFIYKLTPNTKVETSAALLGGCISGITWHVYNQLGFLLVSRALTASKLYGSLAVLVLVMGGLYILWLIILFGAQTAYAYQNRNAYLQDRLSENINQRGREFVALRVMTCLGQRFQTGLRPATVPEISSELGVPSRLTQSILRTLTATRLVSEVAGAEAAFVPARPLDAISAYDVLLAMRTGTGQELPLADAPQLAEIFGEFARIEQAERAAASTVSLLALATRTAPSCALPPPKPISGGSTAASETTDLPPAMPVAEQAADPEIMDSKPAPFPEKLESPEPSPIAEPPPPEPASPPRKEPARPEENNDFPL